MDKYVCLDFTVFLDISAKDLINKGKYSFYDFMYISDNTLRRMIPLNFIFKGSLRQISFFYYFSAEI
jgi:hypothetical protein